MGYTRDQQVLPPSKDPPRGSGSLDGILAELDAAWPGGAEPRDDQGVEARQPPGPRIRDRASPKPPKSGGPEHPGPPLACSRRARLRVDHDRARVGSRLQAVDIELGRVAGRARVEAVALDRRLGLAGHLPLHRTRRSVSGGFVKVTTPVPLGGLAVQSVPETATAIRSVSPAAP